MTARSSPIRVLHLRDSPWIDGPGRTILETATHIDRHRVDFHIGAFVTEANERHPLIEAAKARGGQAHAIKDRPGIDRSVANEIGRLIVELGIDVLHTSEFRSNVYSLLCRRKRRMRTVATVHGWIANDVRGRIYRWADKALLRYFDAVIAVSEATRRLVPRWWLPDSRAHVLHNGLVLDSYGVNVLARPRRRPGDDGNVNLLCVGRLSPEKGHALLFEAAAPLLAGCGSARLRIAGVGPMEQELRRLAAGHGIADKVDFLGYIQDMEALYSETDLVIQSSLTEGMPNVVLEAAYLKVPILATTVGGTGEIIEHGRSGWLVEPGSVTAIRDGIRRFLDEPAPFAAMAEAAHDDVRRRFSFESRTRRLTEIYEMLHAGRS